MLPSCPGVVASGADGSLLCTDATTGTGLAWVEVSEIPPTADLAEAFSAGVGIVIGFWIIAKSLGVVLQAIKRW